MITIELSGRIGNHLFQYAVCRSVAERNGYNFWIDKDKWEGSKLFNVDYGVKDGSVKYEYYEGDVVEKKYNPDIYKVNDFTILKGYFPTEKYFMHEKVKLWFRPKMKVNSEDDVCYIHFRGTDYNREDYWNFYQLPKSYYDEAMRYIINNYGIMKFVIVTDDKKTATSWLPGLDIISTTAIYDFFLLIAAKYFISSNSTFSWWAAYLNKDNIVIAPQGWQTYKTTKKFLPADIKVERFIYI
jgi:hypothetical protein